jgi:hypothetical protein
MNYLYGGVDIPVAQMQRSLHRWILSAVIIAATSSAVAQPWYVSATGSDSGTGTLTSPFRTIEKAVSVVKAGETIYIRGGTYNLTLPVALSGSGTESSRISMLAYPGEVPVLDFSSQSLSSSNRGIVLTGSWWHIKGLDITGAGDNGMIISGGDNNLIELCRFFRNRDSGLQIDNGASDNYILNCDSYFNADPPDFGDADGFAPKLTVGSGNHFYGCRAWRNCDDGWDGYLRGANDVSTTLEYCWAFENGFFEDGNDAGVNANGNGFKMGGSDDKSLMHNFTLRNCLAFGNKSKGFDQNNNKGSMTLYNCTGHDNDIENYRISQELAVGKVLIVKNCAELGEKVSLGAFAVQDKNSWLPPFIVTTADFRSLDPAGAGGLRKSDGTLPHIEYLHLAPGSDLIDAGVDVGIPYSGIAPDLGCFETGLSGINSMSYAAGALFYPNPVDQTGYVRFIAGEGGKCVIRLFDITGKMVHTLASFHVTPGDHTVRLDFTEIRDGVFFLEVSVNSERLFLNRVVRTAAVR